MSLMVWFRKYNKKIMAVVVIVLMIVFTIQPVMNYFSSARTGEGKVIAYYGDGKKISRQDVAMANQQIEILRMLNMESLLRPEDPRYASTQDLRIALLGELIFPERSSAVESISRIKQIVSMDNYGVSDKQINEIYSKQHPASIYWVLLTREAHEAGVRTPIEYAKSQLELIMPRLHRGATYSQVISAIEKRSRVSEEQVLDAFSDMTSVIEYCRTICATENRTIQQVLNQTSLRQETIDVNYVVCGANAFLDESFKPGADKVEEQFEKYKGNFAGGVGEGNPYGFGYKLPERVRLEYIAVRLNDVASTVNPLTQQEAEEYYQQHLQIFTRMVPSDPNDPNSEPVAKTRSYAEVASVISKGLYQQRVDSKAERILLEAKSITEANLSGIEAEQSKLTDEQIKKGSVDYAKVAAELSEKYKVKVYADRTGLLSSSDIQGDKSLAPLYVGGAGVTESPLARVVFAVEQLKTSELGPMDVKAPRLYENIGPLKDAREMTDGYAGKNMMLMRIVSAEKAAEPKNINEKINKRSIRFDRQDAAGEDSNTIREFVIEDLKLLAAMDKAKSKAEEFVALAAKDGWENAGDKFNRIYGKGKDDTNTISGKKHTFTLNTQSGLRRINNLDIETLMTRYEGNPMARVLINGAKREGMLVDKLYALVPEDSNTLAKPGTIVEYKAGMCYYCLESMTIHRLYQEGFDMTKAAEVVRDEFVDSQALAVIHYNPKNIVKRMKFVEIQERQDVAGPNSVPADTNRAGKPEASP
ncbi:MAG: hypothetical protein ABR913_10370 [Sedimentisphaerales bacterium]|jgi:hypothetical protein